MTPVEIGLISILAIVGLIWAGVYIAVALGMVSFIAIWLMRDNIDLAFALTKIAIGDSVMEYTFATIPLFVFMGLIVSKAGLGADIYAVMNQGFRRITGGIGRASMNGVRPQSTLPWLQVLLAPWKTPPASSQTSRATSSEQLWS